MPRSDGWVEAVGLRRAQRTPDIKCLAMSSADRFRRTRSWASSSIRA